MAYRIGIVGVTGAVGQELLALMAKRKFPVTELRPLASARSAGSKVSYGGQDWTVQEAKPEAFEGLDFVIFSAGGSVSLALAPEAVKRGVIVIDNSSAFRMDPTVPLVVPEINAHALDNHQGIIANPNCSTAQMVVALKPLHDRAKIKRVVVSTYQAVSGAGKDAMDELWDQTKSMYNPTDNKPKQVFTKQIAFNVIPHIDVFMDSGDTKEEWKMVVETKKILDKSVKVTATCVRVPVFVGHSESINIEFEEFLDEDEARDILREAPGIMVIDKRENGGYVTPVECAGDFATFISRIRQDVTVENGLNLWCVSDNLRKGAALNAVQVAELLGRECLKKG